MENGSSILSIGILATAVLVILGTLIFAGRAFKIYYDEEAEMKNATKTSAYGEVGDKDSYIVPVGKAFGTKYRIVVDVGGEKHRMTVPASLYNSTEIGDDIEVTIFSNKDKIVRVTYGDLEDENKNSKSVTDAALGAE